MAMKNQVQRDTKPYTKREIRDYRPDWQAKCENCGSSPTVPVTGMCGPCTFGEADMVGGGWWDEGKDTFA